MTSSMTELAVRGASLDISEIGGWSVWWASEAIKRRVGWAYQAPVAV